MAHLKALENHLSWLVLKKKSEENINGLFGNLKFKTSVENFPKVLSKSLKRFEFE